MFNTSPRSRVSYTLPLEKKYDETKYTIHDAMYYRLNYQMNLLSLSYTMTVLII